MVWYERTRRDLPWRGATDPYRILLSEVMLQQTRVAAVLPYYERFLARFPDVESLALSPEPDLLSAWAGLGYYSRARNLQKAARTITEKGEFPSRYEELRALPGVGNYTAAAVASIAFGQPHAVVDGNVLRVLTRVTNDNGDIGATSTRARIAKIADVLLDRRRPGDHNQAVMELGAMVCLPKQPQCLLCPVGEFCEARKQGTARQIPIKLRRAAPVDIEKSLLLIRRRQSILMCLGDGFWCLPELEQLPRARVFDTVGTFRHTITHHHYRFTLLRAELSRAPKRFDWVPIESKTSPVSTIARKALALTTIAVKSV